MREHLYYVYILASRRNGTLYIGVTNNIMCRTGEHKTGLVEGFTKKYGVHVLVWYELFENIHEAIAREKRMKRWNRAWKIHCQKNLSWPAAAGHPGYAGPDGHALRKYSTQHFRSSRKQAGWPAGAGHDKWVLMGEIALPDVPGSP